MQEKRSKRSIGNIGEDAVCGFLERHGYRIVCRNFTVRGGEIDIIAEKDDRLAFVEVKTRKKDSLTTAEEAVNWQKRQRMIKTAREYLFRNGLECECRFDVAAVELTGERVSSLKYYVAAFDASQ